VASQQGAVPNDPSVAWFVSSSYLPVLTSRVVGCECGLKLHVVHTGHGGIWFRCDRACHNVSARRLDSFAWRYLIAVKPNLAGSAVDLRSAAQIMRTHIACVRLTAGRMAIVDLASMVSRA